MRRHTPRVLLLPERKDIRRVSHQFNLGMVVTPIAHLGWSGMPRFLRALCERERRNVDDLSLFRGALAQLHDDRAVLRGSGGAGYQAAGDLGAIRHARWCATAKRGGQRANRRRRSRLARETEIALSFVAKQLSCRASDQHAEIRRTQTLG